MKAIKYSINRLSQVSQDEISLPEMLGPTDVLISPQYVGICGSDLLELETSREFRSIGHEWVGKVIRVGDGVHDLLIDDLVTSLPYSCCGVCPQCSDDKTTHYCRQSRTIGTSDRSILQTAVIISHHLLLKIPHNEIGQSVLYEVFAVAIEAYDKLLATFTHHPLKKLLIIGAGPIGVALGIYLKSKGIDFTITDRRTGRVNWAKENGINSEFYSLLISDPSLASSYSHIIDCSARTGGDQGAATQLYHFASIGAQLIILAKYLRDDQFSPFLLANKKLTTIFISSLSYHTLKRSIEENSTLIANCFKNYVTHIFPIHDIDQAFRTVFEKNNCGKVIVSINSP